MERTRKRAMARNKQLVQEYQPTDLFGAEKPLGIFNAIESDDTSLESADTLRLLI